jgi:hypothetical protein
MSATSPKIGIVSKHSHCKNHMSALSREGFEVVALGASPTSIPPSIDVVVVRTESCSHGGFNTAMNWSRQTGGHLIAENGLSGIRRALNAPSAEDPDFQKYMRAAEMLLRDRPEDTPEQVRDTLLAMGADLATANRVIGAAETSMGSKNTPSQGGVSLFPTPYPNPENVSWASLVPEKRAREQALAALAVYESLDPKIRTAIQGIYTSRKDGAGPYFFPSNSKEFKGKGWETFRELSGRPHQFFVVLLLCLPRDIPQKRPRPPKDIHYSRMPLQRAYEAFSGKRTDGRAVEAAAWATGHTITLDKKWVTRKAAAAPTPVVEVAPEPEGMTDDLQQEALDELVEASPVFEETDTLDELREEMEHHVLDLMTQVSDLKREVSSLRAEIEALRSKGVSTAWMSFGTRASRST